jgi:hypothetical protein
MDVVIANVYFCNSDWPNNNVRFWRCKETIDSIDATPEVQDGRWRWMLFDTDWGFGYTGKEDYQLNLLPKAARVGSIGIIFSGLLKNELFFNTFIKRFKFHLNHSFEKNKVISKINSFETKLAPEIEEHINRWRVIGSYSQWLENVRDLKIFASKRPAVQTQQLNEFITIYRAKH